MVQRDFWIVVVVVFALVMHVCHATSLTEYKHCLTYGKREEQVLEEMKKYAMEARELVSDVIVLSKDQIQDDEWKEFQCVTHELLGNSGTTLWRKVGSKLQGEDISIFVKYRFEEFDKYGQENNERRRKLMMEMAGKAVEVVNDCVTKNPGVVEAIGKYTQEERYGRGRVEVGMYVRKSPFILGTMDLKGTITVEGEDEFYTESMKLPMSELCTELPIVKYIFRMMTSKEPEIAETNQHIRVNGESYQASREIAWRDEELRVEVIYLESEEAMLEKEMHDETSSSPTGRNTDSYKGVQKFAMVRKFRQMLGFSKQRSRKQKRVNHVHVDEGPLEYLMHHMLRHLLCVAEEHIENRKAVPVVITFGPIKIQIKNDAWITAQF